ncbi:MAG: prolipoprotein diacylglyceryl transferase [Lachnospiraceae bacterium]
MDYNINFPNLGIFLDHVGKNIVIGNFSIAYYGIVIAIGMLLGLLVAVKRAKTTGQKPEDYVDLVILGMIFGVIGARIYYVIFAWDMYKDDLLSIFNLRQGGLAIYGGIIAGLITVFVVTRIKHMNFGQAADTVAMSVPIGQILGRWGNFFNREAFGEYTNGLLAMELPVSAVRQNEITEKMWANTVVRDSVTYISVHPTFLYESLWNCGVLLLVFLLRNRTKFYGELWLVYVAGYSLGRFFIEILRTDQLLVHGTNIPVSMVVAAVGFVGSVIWIIVGHRRAVKAK